VRDILGCSAKTCAVATGTGRMSALNQKDKGSKPRNFPKSNAILEIGEHSIEKYFYHGGGPGSIPGQSTCYLWCTLGHWDTFVSQYFCFPLSVSFH
jgi:hypothetical protein